MNRCSTKRFLQFLVVMTLTTACGGVGDVPHADVIYSCADYTVYTDRVVQGEYTATAAGPTEIVTNYRSPDATAQSPLVKFRFSINSRDNELPLGKCHEALLVDSASANDTYTFGRVTEHVDTTRAGETLPFDTRWTVRLDMRPVLDSFERRGYFATVTGDTIYADDFKGVWIAGSVEPLNWDFENLYGKADRRLTDNGEGIYEVTLRVNPKADRPSDPTGWKIDSIDSRFPRYESDQTLVDALYNMSIDCIASNIRPDNTYRAGAAWDGVWTRDVSYSIYLALAYLDPQRAINSLKAKVKNDRIVQDTGTGGSWPVSTDRIVWAVAAWEIYKTTGDKDWLQYAYTVVGNTLKDDMLAVYDRRFGLMHGEQSYLDWREQSYPKWMQPKDIYESMALGTNALFVSAFRIMGEMAEALGQANNDYANMADGVADAINERLWLPERGYYSGYLYGGINPIQSDATDVLGQSLCVIFDIANPEMAKSLIANTPRVTFGTPSVYPQQPDIKPYHNDAVWPFVQSYWNIAAARAGNMEALEAGLGAIYRQAALFATQKELFVASNGDYRGTAINSDKMLWSSAGNVAMLFRVIAGMEFHADSLSFSPFVPKSFTGKKTLREVRYRNAILNIDIIGTGNKIATFSVDGKLKTYPSLPATVEGEHHVEITLDDYDIPHSTTNLTAQTWMPATPILKVNRRSAQVLNASVGEAFDIYVNGTLFDRTTLSTVDIDRNREGRLLTAMIVPVVQSSGVKGFAPAPVERYDVANTLQAEAFADPGTDLIADPEKASRFVESSVKKNVDIEFRLKAHRDGEFAVDVRYANGSGPINTENKCAIRTLFVNGERAGTIVMPQRGKGEWLSTGFSNRLVVRLNKGENTISLRYVTPDNVNMNGTVNTALIDYLRLIRFNSHPELDKPLKTQK